jgi:hypothetical protein
MAFEQGKLVDLRCDGSSKDIFDADKLPQFSLLVKTYYSSLSDKAIKVILPSVTKYLCKTGISDATVIKTNIGRG